MKVNNINYIRKKKGLTLSELAERANISKSYLSTIERNLNPNPSIQIVQKIAAALDVDVHALVGTKTNNQFWLDDDWLEFVQKLKNSGVEKENLQEFKKVIEFAKWQSQYDDKKTSGSSDES